MEENTPNIEDLVYKEEVKPFLCKKCGKKLDYTGLGEYHCPNCGAVEYDDYGLVRHYLEAHPGAKIVEVEHMTKVPRKKIAEMVEEKRFNISQGKNTLL